MMSAYNLRRAVSRPSSPPSGVRLASKPERNQSGFETSRATALLSLALYYLLLHASSCTIGAAVEISPTLGKQNGIPAGRRHGKSVKKTHARASCVRGESDRMCLGATNTGARSVS